MSIKLMSAIFETEMRDLPYMKDGKEHNAKASTAKLLLLALADHANDYGEAFPGYTRLELKTSLSRQGIADTLEALKQNGLVSISEEPSRLGTNNYTVNIRSFPRMAEEAEQLPKLVKPLDQHQSSGLTRVVKPLDHNHHLTTNETPLSDASKKKIIQSANKTVDGILMVEKQSAGKTWTNLPANYHEYGRAFCEATGLSYHKKYLMDWIATFDEWEADGFTPERVTEAVSACRNKGMDISRPGSITWKLRAQKVAVPAYREAARAL